MRSSHKSLITSHFKGFTLIELLVVISIIGVLLSISFFALQGAKASARDAERKSDLQDIRSALEIYRVDCGTYPATITFGSALSATCGGATNTYMSTVPQDPKNPTYSYQYTPGSGNKTYNLCAYLEHGTGSASCTGNCGGTACNFGVKNP